MATSKPKHSIAIGRIEAAIWENRTGDGHVRYNITFSRRWSDGTGRKSATSFGFEDLPVLQKAAEMAFDWISGHPHSG